MSELKPCPFCGGEAAGVIYHNEECTYIRHYVRCRRCDARTGKHKTYEFAENAWNRRDDNER